MSVSCFSKRGSSSEYPRILNISVVLNVREFWMFQDSENGSRFEYARILNVAEF